MGAGTRKVEKLRVEPLASYQVQPLGVVDLLWEA